MSFYLHMIAVAVIVFALGQFLSRESGTGNRESSVSNESVYDRVMRTKTLRCGYAVWPPTAILKDANSGKITGIFPEVIEEAAANMNLKLEWVEETGWGSFIEGLESKRFDAFCAPLWRNAQRGSRVFYTVPLAYSALHFYARVDDHRFDNDLSILNSDSYTLATMDGEMSALVANKQFPKAKQMSIPQLGDITQLLLSVASNKADGVFLEPSLAKDFEKTNPGKIRQVTKQPVSVFPISYGVLIGEDKLQGMLDSALIEMLNQGRVDQLIEKYETDRAVFMPVNKPYQLPSQ